MILTKEQTKEFEEAAKPLITWLNDNCHPHCTAIVSSRDAELVEGLARINYDPAPGLEDSGAAKLSRGHNPVAGDILVDSPTKPEKQTKEWTDPKTKLTWSYHEIGPNNHQQTLDYAKSKKLRLGTKEELEQAEKHGLRKHLGISSGWFWSSSVFPNSADLAYDLNGVNGYIGYGSRGNGYDYGAAVCVAP